MKRPIAILISFLYLMLSSGVGLNVHYCAGKVSSISLNYKKDANCGCAENTKKSCCHDKQAFIKVKDSHQSPADIKIIPVTTNNFLSDNILNGFNDSGLNEVITQARYSPPKYLKKELHIFIRILLV